MREGLSPNKSKYTRIYQIFKYIPNIYTRYIYIYICTRYIYIRICQIFKYIPNIYTIYLYIYTPDIYQIFKYIPNTKYIRSIHVNNLLKCLAIFKSKSAVITRNRLPSWLWKVNINCILNICYKEKKNKIMSNLDK